MNRLRICSTLVVLLVMWCAAYGTPSQALPDSVVTDDNVYRYMFSDTKKAENIMKALRERKKLEGWKLDYTEGDLYYNTGRNYKALTYYVRVLASDKAKKDRKLRMDLLHRMISCYDMTHNEQRKAEYVDRLMREAKACGDKAMQAVALFNMGKSEYDQGNKADGCWRMEQAAAMMAVTKYEYKYDNLRYHYNTLLTYYEQDRRGEDALRMLEALQGVATASTGKEKVGIEGLGDKERKAFYGHRAVVMDLLGRQEAADESYRRFLSIGKPTDRDQYVVMPYLFGRKMYGEILRISKMRERLLQEEGDTVNYHFTTIRKNLARAYFEMGRYREAAVNYGLLAALRDSIKRREQKSAALELAEAYDSAEKDRMVERERGEKRLLGTLIVVFALALASVAYYNRKIRRRNVFLVRAVKEGLAVKDELSRRDSECMELRRKAEGLARQISGLVRNETPGGPFAAPPSSLSLGGTGRDKETEERELLERVVNDINSQNLYLRQGLTQKDVLKSVPIPAYLFGAVFRKYVGESFTEYINRKRMEYAAKLLIGHPEYTVEAIAGMCGFKSKQHFHRQFLKFSGLTPSAFREAVESAESK